MPGDARHASDGTPRHPNARRQLDRRAQRFFAAGVVELYELDPQRESIEQLSLVDGQMERVSAVGVRSPGLELTFSRVDGRLGLCCPAGRAVRAGDHPYLWLAEEMRRADEAELRADIAESRAELAEERFAAAEARLAELERALGEW